MLVFTFVAVNLAACKTPDNRNENLPEIYVDLSKEQDFYDISTDIEPDFEIIALETDDQCMLGQIQKSYSPTINIIFLTRAKYAYIFLMHKENS